MQSRSSDIREIAGILLLKLLVLGAIWLVWFSSPPDPQPWPGASFLSDKATPR